MIVVTGAAGFIGSSLVGALNAAGYKEIVAVDDFSRPDKAPNLEGKLLFAKVNRDEFFVWAQQHARFVQLVFHIGARTNTAEFDLALLNHLNTEYSKQLFGWCTAHSVPLIYASSAATYGDGSMGFDDLSENMHLLKPLNPYGQSKLDFDQWVDQQEERPPFWAGFKFFNVYGPNEYHKGRMASVILHAHQQIQDTHKMRLFRSHRPDYKDGEQLRDFVYVKDVHKVLLYFMHHRKHSGLYNLGSGMARSFNDLANAVFMALNLQPNIEYIDIPEDIRNTYQYYTCANLERLRAAGYKEAFTPLDEGVNDYVKGYLNTGRYF